MTDIGIQYAAIRERITELVAGLSAGQAATPVPACPGWSVHDVVAHLGGSVTDILAGRMDGVGSDEWTAAQVDARRETPIADVLAEWAAGSPQFEDGLRAIGGPMAALAVADAWNHEQDLRGALGHEGGADPAAEHTAIEGYASAVGGGLAAAGHAPLKIVAGATEFATGDGEPGATVTGAPFDLARALAGRRTADQIRALTWSGDADPYVAALSTKGPNEPLPC